VKRLFVSHIPNGVKLSAAAVAHGLATKEGCRTRCKSRNLEYAIPTRGNLFLPVRLLVWADGRGTVAQADIAARAELQEAPKQKLLKLKNIQKYHWVKHREMLICCLGVSLDM
jgi:hypothetical protein